MDHGIGVGIAGIDAERLRQPCAVRRLDSGETKSPLHIPRCDEADPARAEHADTVVEDDVVVGPGAIHDHSMFPVIASVAKQSSFRFAALWIASLRSQ